MEIGHLEMFYHVLPMNKSLFFVCRVMVWYYLEGAEGMRNFQDRALAYLVRNDLEGQQISEDFCRARLPL
jgi:hypothetical protein